MYHKWQSYDVWFLGYGAWQTKCLVILDYFLHFYPSNNTKNQNLKKMKEKLGDIIILHMCTINDNHMMYGSWEIKLDRQNFLSFWTVLCPFTPLTTPKIKILKKWKQHLEILSFYTSTINDNHILYGSWDMKCDRQNFLSFWIVFSPFPWTYRGGCTS